MKFVLTTCAAALFATAAFAAGPGMTPNTTPDPMAPAPAVTPTMAPASTMPSASCADMIAKARAMAMPTDAAKAGMVKTELAAADDASDDASCKAHVTNAMNTLGGQ